MGQLRAFVEGNEAVDFQPESRDEAYGFVRDTLDRFGYRGLGKRDRGVVLRFLVAATGLSLKQMERLVRQWRETGSDRLYQFQNIIICLSSPITRSKSRPNAPRTGSATGRTCLSR